MDVPETVGAAQAVQQLSRASGEAYELIGRLPGGETGAHLLLGPDGRRVVAKWDRDPSSQADRLRAVDLTNRLREDAGWPVPQQRTIDADGCLFVIQEHVAGTPIEALTHELVDDLLDLHHRRAGLERPEDDSSWPGPLIHTLTDGGSGYCLHEPLRSFDDRTARLVLRVEQIGRAAVPGDLRGGDVVHWDFHPGNLLGVDGRVAAVIDNDFVTTGDAAFDLVTLYMTALTVPCERGVRRRLFEAAIDPLDAVRRRTYVAHLLLRFIDWPIRRGRVEEVEFWLSQADRLLGS